MNAKKRKIFTEILSHFNQYLAIIRNTNIVFKFFPAIELKAIKRSPVEIVVVVTNVNSATSENINASGDNIKYMNLIFNG